MPMMILHDIQEIEPTHFETTLGFAQENATTPLRTVSLL
jgi:hypothetical protein